jgi:predicted nucleic acid-binding protein
LLDCKPRTLSKRSEERRCEKARLRVNNVLVVDASVIIAALITKGTTFKTLFILHKRGIVLVSPGFLLDEIKEHKEEIVSKYLKSEKLFLTVLNKIKERIVFFPLTEYEHFLEEAKNICLDRDDVPYVALSLALNKAPIWTFDKGLKEDCLKAGIKVALSNKEVIKEFTT